MIPGRSHQVDEGSAVVDFVRNVVAYAAAEGAHLSAVADQGPIAGQRRAVEVVHQVLGRRFVVRATGFTQTINGTPMSAMRVEAPLPVLGPWLGAGSIAATGHALLEPR